MTTVDQLERARASHYARVNRQQWAHAGFRNITARAHYDDRGIVLTYIEVVKCERLVTLAEGKNDADILAFIASRNAGKVPTMAEMVALDDASDRVKGILSRIKHEIKRATSAQKEMELDPTSDRPEAKYKARTLLAVALYHYAVELAIQDEGAKNVAES